jgi:lysozyme
MTKRKTSKSGKDLIKSHEGFKLNAYLCPAGVPTIGFGTTRIKGNPVQMGMMITTDEANILLEEDLKLFEDAVNHLVKVFLNQNQFDALVSFVYNVGVGNFRSSTLLRLLNEGKYIQAAEQFLRWNKAKGKVLPGLIRRRTEEMMLFLKKDV